MEGEAELAWCFFEEVVGSIVPDLYSACAVLAFADGALEASVFEGVVFDLHGEAFDAWFGWGSFGDGPALEDSLHLEAEVEVVLGCPMFLYDEGWHRFAGVVLAYVFLIFSRDDYLITQDMRVNIYAIKQAPNEFRE